MRVLVTGGAGFIGSGFLRYVKENRPDWEVWCLDKLTYAGRLENLAGVLDGDDPHFIRGDIADASTVRDAFRAARPEAVVNFAAESHVDRSIRDPGAFLASNVVGVQVLLDACLEFGVGRFHQVSTDEVYGDLALDEGRAFTEDDVLRPSSPYAASKAAADLLCGAYARTYGANVTISRASNNFGPRQFPEKLIPLALRRAMADRPVPLYGDGRNVRDWLYVDDHCAAIVAIVERGTPGRVYNVGGDCPRSNLEIVEALLAMLGKPADRVEFVPDRPGHDRRYALDSARIRRELGWTPVTDFRTGLARTVRWYQEAEG